MNLTSYLSQNEKIEFVDQNKNQMANELYNISGKIDDLYNEMKLTSKKFLRHITGFVGDIASKYHWQTEKVELKDESVLITLEKRPRPDIAPFTLVTYVENSYHSPYKYPRGVYVYSLYPENSSKKEGLSLPDKEKLWMFTELRFLGSGDTYSVYLKAPVPITLPFEGLKEFESEFEKVDSVVRTFSEGKTTINWEVLRRNDPLLTIDELKDRVIREMFLANRYDFGTFNFTVTEKELAEWWKKNGGKFSWNGESRRW